MRCSGCATENEPDRRFCGECGSPLLALCPDCSFKNQPSAKYCGGCGRRFSAPLAFGAADHLRKSVATLDHEAGRKLFRFGGLVLAFSASFFSWTLAELGRFAEAETAGLMGLDLATQANHAYSISVASFGLGHVRLRQGRFADAIQILERGYEQTKLHNIDAAVDQVVFRLIYAYSRAGRIEEARALGQAANPEGMRLNLWLSIAHFWLCVMALETDRIDAALRATREAYRSAELRGEKPTVAWLEHLLGDLVVCTDPADVSTAAEHYRAAAAIASDLGMKPLLTECHFSLGDLARRAGRAKEAETQFKAALELAESMGLEPAAERACQHLRDLN